MASKEHLKKIQRLSLALFVSGAVNIVLSAFLMFWALSDRPLSPYFEPKPLLEKENVKMLAASVSNADVLRRYKAKSYQELTPFLYKTDAVEDGYKERDLALGVLVAFHEFDLEKALGAQLNTSQKKMLSFDEGKEKVIVYPHLTKQQFDLIYAFLKIEKWPLKAKGLFFLLKNEQAKHEPSLYEAFYLTQEFNTLETLFKGHLINKDELAQVAIEGSWSLLSTFNEKQKRFQNSSSDVRRQLLLSYIQEGSRQASLVLLKTDFDFATKKMSDIEVLKMVRLLNQNTQETARFLQALAGSSRPDAVKQLATLKFLEVTGKAWEPLVSRETTTLKPPVIDKVISFPSKIEAPKVAVKSTPQVKKSLLYIVQDGDSLWKIAKRFKVSMDDIRSLNQLKNDALKPGTPLKVPDHGPPGAKDGTLKSVLR